MQHSSELDFLAHSLVNNPPKSSDPFQLGIVPRTYGRRGQASDKTSQFEHGFKVFAFVKDGKRLHDSTGRSTFSMHPVRAQGIAQALGAVATPV